MNVGKTANLRKILQSAKKGFTDMNIAFFLTPKINVAYLNVGDSIRQGLEKFRRYGYTALPVLNDEGKYVGFISEGDFLRNILSIGSIDLRDMEQAKIDDIIHKDEFSVKITSSMDDLVSSALDRNFIPVTDDRDMFTGIVTRRSILEYFFKNYIKCKEVQKSI